MKEKGGDCSGVGVALSLKKDEKEEVFFLKSNKEEEKEKKIRSLTGFFAGACYNI